MNLASSFFVSALIASLASACAQQSTASSAIPTAPSASPTSANVASGTPVSDDADHGSSPAAGGGATVYDRNGNAEVCGANVATTPLHPAACLPEAPDTAFFKTCEGAGFKIVMCENCFALCTGKVTAPKS